MEYLATDSLLTAEQIAEHWRQRAARPGLSRVMRASQPEHLAAAATDATVRTLTRLLDVAAAGLGRPLGPALEIGCGIGRLTPALAGRADRVVALDMTARMLDAARHNCRDLGNVEFRLLPAQRLPLEDGPLFDVALCVWVLMHVLDPDELARVCAGIAASARYLVLVEYEYAAIPVGPYSRLRSLEDYLELFPGAHLVQRGEIDYGGDRSFAALIAFDH